MIEQLASQLGAPVGAVRLLLSFLVAYIMGYVYRALLLDFRTKYESLRHIYHIVCGLALLYFNYGTDALHLINAVIGVWTILRIGGPTKVVCWLASIFAFVYLLYGYSYHRGEEYTIDWTTSYCVLCLRLIGLSIDYYDGSKRKRKDSTPAVSKRPCSWDDAALDRLPSLLPTLGFCFHYGGCIVGPQFPFVVYRRFISMESFRLVRGENSNDKREVYAVPECGQAVLRCFLIGAFYMAISEIGKTILPPQYVGTVKYGVDLSFSQRLIYMIIAGKFVLHKYLGVWSMNEGACILSGISFNGYDNKTGRPLWDGLSNVQPWLFDTATSLSQVIQSFNTNTNLWAKNYIYKRLKFLGSKLLSGFGTLMFLAIWHGFAPGYFAAFLVEFLEMEAERKLRNLFSPVLDHIYDQRQKGWLAWTLRIGMNVIQFLLTAACLAYGSLTFDLLAWKSVYNFWKSNNHWVMVGIIVVFIIDTLKVSPSKKRSSVKRE